MFVCAVTFPIVFLSIDPTPANLTLVKGIAYIIAGNATTCFLFGNKIWQFFLKANPDDNFALNYGGGSRDAPLRKDVVLTPLSNTAKNYVISADQSPLSAGHPISQPEIMKSSTPLNSNIHGHYQKAAPDSPHNGSVASGGGEDSSIYPNQSHNLKSNFNSSSESEHHSSIINRFHSPLHSSTGMVVPAAEESFADDVIRNDKQASFHSESLSSPNHSAKSLFPSALKYTAMGHGKLSSSATTAASDGLELRLSHLSATGSSMAVGGASTSDMSDHRKSPVSHDFPNQSLNAKTSPEPYKSYQATSKDLHYLRHNNSLEDISAKEVNDTSSNNINLPKKQISNTNVFSNMFTHSTLGRNSIHDESESPRMNVLNSNDGLFLEPNDFDIKGRLLYL